MTDEYRDDMHKEILLEENKVERKLRESCVALELESKSLRNLADAVEAVRAFGCQFHMGMAEPEAYRNLANFKPAELLKMCSDVIALHKEQAVIRQRKRDAGL
jgi:hypothetical protein